LILPFPIFHKRNPQENSRVSQNKGKYKYYFPFDNQKRRKNFPFTMHFISFRINKTKNWIKENKNIPLDFEPIQLSP